MTNKSTGDGKTEKFKFNVIDILIILIIIAVLSFIIYCIVLGNDLSDIGAKNAEAEYSVVISRVDISYKDSISVGDMVTNAENGNAMGVVSAVSYTYSSDGEHTYDDKVDIKVTIVCNAKLKGGKYYCGGVQISSGESISLHFTGFDPSEKSYISDIKISD